MEKYVSKIAIVTGASSGIGTALAKELAKRGCIVIGLARRMDKLQMLEDEIRKMQKASEGTFHPIQCDVSDEEQIKTTMNYIQHNHGIPSIVINNAGVVFMKPLLEMDRQSIDTMINTNARGSILLTQIAVKLMSENSIQGHIINMSSIVGHTTCNPDYLFPYAGSKYMVRVFSEGIRQLVEKNGWNIKVTDISPGLVQSEMTENLPGIEKVWKKILTPEDVAKACSYILDTPPNVMISEMIITPTHCHGMTYN